MKKVEIITNLIYNSRQRTLSQEEQGELDAWLAESDENSSLFTTLNNEHILLEKFKVFSSVDSKALWQMTQQRIKADTPVVSIAPVKRGWWKITAAAAAVVVVATGSWFYLNSGAEKTVAQQKVAGESNNVQIVPGGLKATLLLADGKEINLTGANNNSSIEEGGIVVTRASGKLVYNNGEEEVRSMGPAAAGKVLYHKVTTPKGGQYQIALPDGSIVWLNAASSLRFPIAFAGSERNVLLTGEAFFEVRHQKDRPFTVSVATKTGEERKVEVLGTEFNVNAYADEEFEDVMTTLLKGSVKVITPSNQQVIKPGEQAIVSIEGNVTINKNVKVMDIVSWKNGLISLKGADVRSFMREIERWYDVRVQYNGKIPVKSFDAEIHRTSSLTDVLKVLELNGVETKLIAKERKIIVTS